MRVLYANIEEVFREAAARWTLVAYFALSTIFILIFAASVNLDIVDGALAGAKLFGHDVQMHGRSSAINIEELVLGFESGFSGVLFVIGIFLAVFATAHLVPRLQDKGTVDLYLSRPVGRVRMLLSRYVAGLALAALNVGYLIGTVWLIVVWKTHVFHPRFLLGAVVILFAIAALLALAFLIGVATSSTAVSIMSAFAIFIASLVLAGHERMEAALTSWWSWRLVRGSYWILPKMYALLKITVDFVSGGELRRLTHTAIDPMAFISTGAFTIGCLALASYLFQRKEF